MVCAAAFTGGSSVCRCNSATQYYDSAKEACVSLKTYMMVCRDSSECQDAYPVGFATQALGFCGFVPGGSLSVCQCIYNVMFYFVCL